MSADDDFGVRMLRIVGRSIALTVMTAMAGCLFARFVDIPAGNADTDAGDEEEAVRGVLDDVESPNLVEEPIHLAGDGWRVEITTVLIADVLTGETETARPGHVLLYVGGRVDGTVSISVRIEPEGIQLPIHSADDPASDLALREVRSTRTADAGPLAAPSAGSVPAAIDEIVGSAGGPGEERQTAVVGGP